MRRLFWGGLVAAALLAALAGPFASREPDGLQRVAADQGFAETEREHALGDAPLAGYSVEGVEDERVGTGLAGIAGALTAAAVVTGVLRAFRRRREDGP